MFVLRDGPTALLGPSKASAYNDYENWGRTERCATLGPRNNKFSEELISRGYERGREGRTRVRGFYGFRLKV
jgi:hypothetical protein